MPHVQPSETDQANGPIPFNRDTHGLPRYLRFLFSPENAASRPGDICPEAAFPGWRESGKIFLWIAVATGLAVSIGRCL